MTRTLLSEDEMDTHNKKEKTRPQTAWGIVLPTTRDFFGRPHLVKTRITTGALLLHLGLGTLFVGVNPNAE